MNDLISRQDAIRQITGYNSTVDKSVAKRLLTQMPSAQSEQSRIEKALHGLKPEEQFKFIDDLMHRKSVGWNSTALYVKAWLAGEED